MRSNDVAEKYSIANNLKNMIGLAIMQAISDGYGIKMPMLFPMLCRIEANPNQIAANSLAIMLSNMLIITASAPVFSIASKTPENFATISRGDATNDEKNAAGEAIIKTTTSAFAYGAAASIPVTLCLVFSSNILQLIFRQSEEIANHAQEILRPFAIAAPTTMLIIGSQQICTSSKNMQVTLPSTIILALSLFASARLGLGLGKIPENGKSAILGSYIAEPWVNSLIYFLFLKSYEKTANFTFIDKKYLSLNNIKEFLKVGIWPSATIFAELMLGFSTTAISAKFGTDAQASIGYTYQSLWPNTFLAVKLALASMVQLGHVKGDFKGTTDKTLARSLAFKTAIQDVITTFSICTIIPIIFVSNPDIMLSIFGKPNAAIEDNIRKTAPFFATGFSFDAICFALLFQSRTLDDHVISGICRIVGFTFGAILGALLSLTFNMGIEGLALGYMLGMMASAISVSTRWYKALNKTFPLPETESLLGNDQNNGTPEIVINQESNNTTTPTQPLLNNYGSTLNTESNTATSGVSQQDNFQYDQQSPRYSNSDSAFFSIQQSHTENLASSKQELNRYIR